LVIAGLVAILLMVLTLPFAIKKIEENLEPFLFVMGVAAALISGIMTKELIIEALEEPIMIATAVLVAGALFFIFRNQFAHFMQQVYKKIPVPVVVFIVIVVLGLASSIITAIVASIVLVEVITLLPLERKHKITVCVLACFSIGFGAALTPIGEPLATITISKLNQDFFFLMRLLGKFIIPAVVVIAALGGGYTAWAMRGQKNLETMDVAATAEPEGLDEAEEMEQETWKGIIIRALKVYLFVMALVFLGEGFQPLIDKYILVLNYRLLYWVNMISAVLDNATLAAAEISIEMSILQIEAILMGLIISGGMLIPGNIPNIISASKLRIGSTEWAKIGVPFGLVSMAVFYFILF
jgi:predicted cation transporter